MAAEYITDVPYPHFFQRETTPIWLSFVARALGRASPDLRQPFVSCELGCGQGFATVLQAVANPHGHFVGVDFNARHIAHARALAKAAGVSNVEFVEDSFQAMLENASPSPRYDFIILHGVYSWVPSADRQRLRQFVERQLKPDGIVFLGYMAQPGLDFFAAPRRFVQQYAQTLCGSSAQRVVEALRALQRLCASGAGLFAHDRQVAGHIERSLQDDPCYLAHELLNEHWSTLPVAEVMADFESCGTGYIGSASLMDNIDDLSLPANVIEQLAGLQGAALRETFKDLARNQTQRRDLYQRGGSTLDEYAHKAALFDQVVAALPGAPASGGVTFDTRIGAVEGAEQLFSPILQALAQRPQSFPALLRLPALAGQAGSISPALQALAAAGHVHPLLPGQIDLAGCQAFNRVISERVLGGARYSHLAAPSLGSGISANFVEMAAARVLLDHPHLRGAALRQTVDALLRKVGWQPLANPVDPLQAQLSRFESDTLPIWQQLGVVG
ncbi:MULTISPECIES: class I SAM-dependent methyltransferase [Pseudomonas]|uniref:SAM-dependent methyltransferase n=1 Tax=Pseudomonas fulva TaxID=47880 RepID=A0A0D0KBB4_9PSED|nr:MULTISPECIES: class I SAM-dependent methyltransferase [Pseudomonas]KIQ06304.1 SAM-dependent methyltransferase [Pseudomonas fulva]